MAPQGEETAAVEVAHEQQDDDDKVEIPAPPSPDMDSEKKDNNADVDDEDGKKDTQRKMTVAADAPWSARMVRTQCCSEF